VSREWKVPGDVLGSAPPRLSSPASAAGPTSAVNAHFVIAITSRVQSAAPFCYTSIVNVTFGGSS